MLKMQVSSLRTLKWRAATAAVAWYASISFGKTDVPVFLFSGQSNMVCLGAATSGLSADQKKPVDNIKIDCRADNNTKPWTTLGPGFGADANHFGVYQGCGVWNLPWTNRGLVAAELQ
jgi:hypothetical protein